MARELVLLSSFCCLHPRPSCHRRLGISLLVRPHARPCMVIIIAVPRAIMARISNEIARQPAACFSATELPEPAIDTPEFRVGIGRSYC